MDAFTFEFGNVQTGFFPGANAKAEKLSVALRLLFFLKNGRRFFEFIIVSFAVLSLLNSFPASLGQSLTTIVTTITTPVTTVGTVKSTIGSTQALSTIVYTAAYTTMFIIKPPGTGYGCRSEAYGPFTLTKGEALSYDITLNTPISIYIMSANDYQTWTASNACKVRSALYSREQVSSDYIDMVAPSKGDYYLILLNLSQTSSASINVGYTDIAQVITTIQGPDVTEFPTTETQTATSMFTEVQPVTDTLQTYAPFAIILVLIIALSLIAFRRHSKKRSGTETVAARQAVLVSGKFCRKCGKPIRVSTKFCPACGAGTAHD